MKDQNKSRLRHVLIDVKPIITYENCECWDMQKEDEENHLRRMSAMAVDKKRTEPSRPTSGQARIVAKPWGEEWWLVQTDRYAGKVLVIHKGHRFSLQYHRVKHETQLVWDGRIKLEIGPDADHLETRILGPGAVTPIPPGTYHRLEALEDSHVFEVSTPELDDVVRVSDDYGREGTAKP